MMRFSTLALALVLSSLGFAAVKTIQTGKIVLVEEKTNTRILYYLVDTPVTKDDPYYEVTVNLGDTQYLGIYTPRHKDDLLPPEWLPGAAVQLRMEEKQMILITPTGRDVDFAIEKRTAIKPEEKAQPAAATK